MGNAKQTALFTFAAYSWCPTTKVASRSMSRSRSSLACHCANDRISSIYIHLDCTGTRN